MRRMWRVGRVLANASDGTLGAPACGEFKNGGGEFYDQESFKGRAILVKQIYITLSKDAYDFDQAFSDDSGKMWEANWIAHVTRDGSPALSHHSPKTPIQHGIDEYRCGCRVFA